MAEGVWVSLYDSRDLVPRPDEFAGLANYRWLYRSPATVSAIRVTVVYVVATTAAATLAGLASALTLNASFRGRALFRAALTIPWGTPLVATALIWFWMFDPQYGVVNYGVRLLGLSHQGIAWLHLAHLGPAGRDRGRCLADVPVRDAGTPDRAPGDRPQPLWRRGGRWRGTPPGVPARHAAVDPAVAPDPAASSTRSGA